MCHGTAGLGWRWSASCPAVWQGSMRTPALSRRPLPGTGGGSSYRAGLGNRQRGPILGRRLSLGLYLHIPCREVHRVLPLPPHPLPLSTALPCPNPPYPAPELRQSEPWGWGHGTGMGRWGGSRSQTPLSLTQQIQRENNEKCQDGDSRASIPKRGPSCSRLLLGVWSAGILHEMSYSGNKERSPG